MPSIGLKYVEIRNSEVWARRDEGWLQLESWQPNNAMDFEVFYYLGIGPLSSNDTSEFHFVVLSNKNYEEMPQEDRRALRTRWKFYVVERYDWVAICIEINRRISICDRGDWADSLAELRQQFSWEFENYNKPAPPEMH